MFLNWKKDEGLRLAVIAASVFFAFTLIIALHRHFTFYSSYDQGIFNQVFWNNLHGRWFESSLSSQLSTNVVHGGDVPEVFYHRLGQHFTPALLIWLPIYALFPNPATLTVIQVVLVTAAGIVLYFLAREYVTAKIAGMLTLSFYWGNAILTPTLNNFHDISQIPLYSFTLLLAMEKRWWWLFGVMSVLIVAVREDGGISLFSVGVYLILSKRYPRIGLGVCLFSFLYMIGLTNLIMPFFSDDISKRFMLERFGQYVEGDNASTLDIIWAMVSQPWLLLVELVSPIDRTLNYLLGQWLPLAFVPAISPTAWLVAGFPLLKLFLGKGVSVLSLAIRYAMTVVPGMFYGAILWWGGEGFRQFGKPREVWQPRHLTTKFKAFWLFCITLSFIFAIISTNTELSRAFYFILPDSVNPWVYVSLGEQWQHTREIRDLMAKIPDDASVSATTHIIPHLSSRREIIRLPDLELRNDQREVIKVDYAIADLWRLERYQAAFKQDRAMLQSLRSRIEQMTTTGDYGIIGFNDGVILLQRGVSSQPQAAADWLRFEESAGKFEEAQSK